MTDLRTKLESLANLPGSGVDIVHTDIIGSIAFSSINDIYKGGEPGVSENIRYFYAFAGRAKKPSMYMTYTNSVKDLVKSFINRIAYRVDRKEAERNFKTSLIVGDVLVSSWGYEQTNVDYYQVVGVKKNVVKLRKIHAIIKQTEYMSGECVPAVDEFIGDEVLTKRVTLGEYVKMKSYTSAHLESYELDENGKKIYKPRHYSSYY